MHHVFAQFFAWNLIQYKIYIFFQAKKKQYLITIIVADKYIYFVNIIHSMLYANLRLNETPAYQIAQHE